MGDIDDRMEDDGEITVVYFNADGTFHSQRKTKAAFAINGRSIGDVGRFLQKKNCLPGFELMDCQLDFTISIENGPPSLVKAE